MAILCLDDASVVINSVDLSDHVTSVEIPVNVDDIDTTAMGTSGWRTRKGGLIDLTVSLTFQQDYAASNVDATLWAAAIARVAVPCVVKPTSGSVTATNPSFSGNIIITDYTPVSGSPGELSTFSVSWPSDGVFTRGTS